MKRLNLLFLLLFVFIAAKALEINVNGIYYYISDLTPTEARVWKTPGYGKNYPNLKGDLVIPETINYGGYQFTVTSIGPDAFKDCWGLSSVTIPNTVTKIYSDAFSGCKGLKSVTIGESVEEIDYRAFKDCPLTFIKVLNPEPPIIKEDYVDETINTKNPTTVQVPEGCIDAYRQSVIINNKLGNASNVWAKFKDITDQEDKIFNVDGYFYSINKDGISVTLHGPSNKQLTSINIPDAINYKGKAYWISVIENGAFENCYSLAGNLTIPKYVYYIGTNAFKNCTKLTGPLEFSNFVKYIGESAFSGCKFTSLTLSESLKEISACCFSGNDFQVVTIPDSVKKIGGGAFRDCFKLNSLTIGKSVQVIGHAAFEKCTNLSGEIYIPSSVTLIDAEAFFKCSNITSVVIGRSVKKIGDDAFARCNKIERMRVLTMFPPQANNKRHIVRLESLNNTAIENKKTVLEVPAGSLESYKYNSPWDQFVRIYEFPANEIEVRE